MTAQTRRGALEALVDGLDAERATPPILVPADPYFHLAGEGMRRRLVLTAGGDGPDYCLRPDFTLPIAEDYLKNGSGPAAYCYLGPLFRRRAEGPAEFEQAGLELIAQPDPDAALDAVFGFALDALAAYGLTAPRIRLGSVAMFEALLGAAELPDVWRPRLRDRFGDSAIVSLVDRLADPHGPNGHAALPAREALVGEIAETMMAAGLPLSGGRTPEEIADRALEKQALDAAHAPEATIAALKSYLEIKANPEAALAVARQIAGDDPAFAAAADTLGRHAAALAARAPEATIVFDAGFAPRLDYYTGIVFEMSGQAGGVLVSGGQYDRLLQRLGAGTEIAASGCAVWVERLAAEADQ